MHLQHVCSAQDLLLEHCIYYFVYGLLDFMQLVDSAFIVHMQHTGFTIGTLCILYNVYRLRFYAASG